MDAPDPKERATPAGQNRQFVNGPAQGFALVFNSIIDQAHEIPSITIKPLKLLVTTYYLQTLCAKDEWELHKVHRTMSSLLISALSPYFATGSLLDKTPTDDQRKRYGEVKETAKACGLTRISTRAENIGNIYTLKISTATTIHDAKKQQGNPVSYLDQNTKSLTEVTDPDVVAVPESAFELGLNQARDNAFGKINCGMETVVKDLMTLAFELNLISLDESIVLDRHEVKPGDIAKSRKDYEGVR